MEKSKAKRYQLSKKDYKYNEYNSLKALDTSSSECYLWKLYFELKEKVEKDPSDRVLEQQYRDIRYAIAAVDFLEEVASLYYDNEVSNMNHRDMKRKVADIRYNVIHAKKGGRFRLGDNTPPTQYRTL